MRVKLKLHRVCIYKLYGCCKWIFVLRAFPPLTDLTIAPTQLFLFGYAAAKTAEPRTSSHRERTMHALPGDRLPWSIPIPYTPVSLEIYPCIDLLGQPHPTVGLQR